MLNSTDSVKRIVQVLLPAFLIAANAAFAQPVITGGPVNGASFVLKGLPNGNIAQGSFFTLFGTSMGPANLVRAANFPLPTILSNVSIRVTVNNTQVSAIMLYAQATVAAAILPSSTPVGTGTVTITMNSQTSAPVPITVVPTSLGILALNSAGVGPGLFTDVNFGINTFQNSFIAGQPAILWATGLGPVSGNEAAGPLPGDIPVNVKVFVGNIEATLIGKSRSGCCAGVDQIAFFIPSNTIISCAVPVYVVANGVTSNVVTIAISTGGPQCSDPNGLVAGDFLKGSNIGSLSIADITLYRLTAAFSFGGASATSGEPHTNSASISGVITYSGSADLIDASFKRMDSNNLIRSARGAYGNGFPPEGTCSVYGSQWRDDILDTILFDFRDPITFANLDAGPNLNFSNSTGIKSIARTGSVPGDFHYNADGPVGGSIPGVTPNLPDFLIPGAVAANNGATGGADVKAYTTSVTVPGATATPSGFSNINDINRNQDFTLNFSGGNLNNLAVLSLTSTDTVARVGASMICTARVNAGRIIVPSAMLQLLPASGIDPATTTRVGFLSFGELVLPTRFSAQGLDVGFMQYIGFQSRNVAVR